LLFGGAGLVILARKFFGKFVRIDRVFVSLTAEFVRAEVVAFIVSGSGGGVGVSRQVVKLGSSIVRTLRHGVFLQI
jgi:hypothetical protein